MLRLWLKLLVPMAATAALLMMFVMLYWSPRVAHDGIRAARAKIEGTLSAAAQGLVPHLAARRRGEVAAMLEMLAAQNPRWSALALEDENGDLLWPASPPDQVPETYSKRRLRATIGDPSAPLGALSVTYDMRPLIERVERRTRTLEYAILAGIMAFFAATLWLLHGAVLKPLKRLMAATDALAASDTPSRQRRVSRDAVSDLIVSFTQMRERVRAAMRLAETRHGELERLLEREKAQRQRAYMMQQVVQNTQDGVAVTHREGHLLRISYVNDAFRRLSALEGDLALGRDLTELLVFAPAQAERFRLALEAGNAFRGEVQIRGTAKALLWTELSLTPIPDQSGGPPRLAALLRDISGRKRVERALMAEKRRAEAASEAKSQFLANVSHEIRTPMNGIIGIVDLLRETPLSERQRDYTDTIAISADALLGIINEILDFSRIEAGQMILDPAPVDLRRMVEEALGLLGPAATRKGLRLEADHDRALPPWVEADGARLRQCLLNLAGNAVKFTEQGHVRVETRVLDTREIAIGVQDTGIGIAAEKLETIFRAFEQVDNHLTRSFEGTGLGLAITQRLAVLMGGRVEVSSTPGEGSRFTLILALRPCAPSAAPDAPMPAAPTDPRILLGTRRVLIADDNRTNREVIRAMLAPTGAALSFAEDGEAAVAAARTMPRPDVVLMDVSMPRKSGITATEEIRAAERAADEPPTPIIALTANAQGETPARCTEAGMTGFLSKPVRREQLLAAIEAALGEDSAAA